MTPEDVKNFYYNWWTQKGTLPSVADCAKAFDSNPVLVNNIIEDKKFRDVLVRRGLPLSSKQVLTPDQFKCIAILTDPTIKGNQAARLKTAGVAWNTYRAWMQQPAFREAMNKTAEQILELNLSGVNMGLVSAAERGEIPAIKFFYEVTGRYDPTEKKALDVMSVLSQVVEILSEEVTDTAVLERIAARLQLVATGSGIGLPRQQAPVAAYKPYRPNLPVLQGEIIPYDLEPLGDLP